MRPKTRAKIQPALLPEMPPEVLAVGEPLEAGEADEALRLVVVQLPLSQAQPVALGHARSVLPGHHRQLGRPGKVSLE